MKQNEKNIKNEWIEKLSQFKKLQKTYSLYYTILKSLVLAIQQDSVMPLEEIYQLLIRSLPQQIKSLHLYKQLAYQIWKRQDYPLKVRQQCSDQILKAVTQWIMLFQIKVDTLGSTKDKFKLIRQFIVKNCKSIQTTILIINQVFDDLKDLFDQSFWNLPQQNLQTYKQYTFIVDQDPTIAEELIPLLQLLIFRQIQLIETKLQINQESICYLSTIQTFTTQNYYIFILKCLNYILCLDINLSQQSQVTKLALEFMRNNYCIKNYKLTTNLFKRLMLRTKKSVRYALVEEYVQTYDFFKKLNVDEIIEDLEDIIYFRELIIGHSKAEKENKQKNLEQNISHQYFSQIIVKAGSKQRVFFSMQNSIEGILKLQIFIEEGMNINLKIVQIANGGKQIPYHEELKTQLRKLDLKLKFQGLYAIELDNSYSWIHGKKILFNIQLMKKIDKLQEIIEHKK